MSSTKNSILNDFASQVYQNDDKGLCVSSFVLASSIAAFFELKAGEAHRDVRTPNMADGRDIADFDCSNDIGYFAVEYFDLFVKI